MNQNDWQDFLTTTLKNSPKYGNNSDFLCATEHLGLISVQGEEADTFLQNQFSNDIAKIDQHTCQLNTYSNHKGRLHSIFSVIKYQQGFLLILPLSQVAFMLQRLQMFVIMAKVTLEDVSEHWAKMGFVSEKQADELFSSDQQVIQSDQQIAIRLNSQQANRVLLLVSLESAQQTWQSLESALTLSDVNQWHLSIINEGIPSLTPETSEAFVLQMANLHLLDGVSFKKGCFPGQEIVARTRYLGKAKRRMYLAHVELDTQPMPAEELCHIDSEIADGSGKIVNAAQASENSFDFLFVGNIDKTESHSLKLLNHPTAKLTLKKLPYSFDE